MDYIWSKMMDLGDSHLDFTQKDEAVMGDLHLNSAINLDQIEELVFPGKCEYRILVNQFYHREWDNMQRDFPSLLSLKKTIGWRTPTLLICQDSTEKVELNLEIFNSLVNLLKDAKMNKGIYNQIVQYADKIIEHKMLVKKCHLYPFEILLRTLCMATEVSREGDISVYRDVNKVGSAFCHSNINLERNGFSIIAGRNIFLVEHIGKERVYIGNDSSALLMLDTLGQRICLEIGCQLSHLAGIPGSIPENVYTYILKYGDNILRLLHNNGYEVIGMFEATVVSCILERNQDPISSYKDFVENCVAEVREICEKSKNGSEALDRFMKLRKFLLTLDDNILSNIFCLYRIWGHPRVNLSAGMEKVIDKGTKYKEIDDKIPLLVLYQFRKMFLLSYYDKNKTYPPLEITTRSYLSDCISKNIPINDKHYGFHLEDFKGITIGQIWTIPETYDICHILNDKAVSPTRSELVANIKAGRGTQCGQLRRGIIRWMNSKSIRCAEFLKDIDSNGIEEDSLIIGMYEKEREIKVKARMFSLMSEKMRYYFVLTEEMIANFLLPYFPQITMKDSMNVLQRKLWKASGKRTENTLDPNINIDFEKWNLNMREKLTLPLFEQMDQMFGFKNCISRTHEIFYHSFIYASSGSYIPLVIDNLLNGEPPMSYYGHLGGFEGLRQKGWTIATICILAYIADILGVRVNLLGQGDNQVVKISMPYSRWDSYKLSYDDRIKSAKALLNRFMVHMEDRFELAKLPIKTRESWVSCHLFMYGKVMILKGNTLPQWCKKLLRSYALSNEGVLTVSGVVGTIATNMSSSAAVSTSPDIMYLIYLFLGEWSLDYLLNYHPFTRRSLSTVKNEYVRIPGKRNRRDPSLKIKRIDCKVLKALLLLIPTACGGSVTIPWTSFVFRGFPDHASESYSWLKMLSSVPSPFRSYLKNYYTFLKNDTIEADMLLQSPWSLNHMKPPTPGLQSRETVRGWLLGGSFPENQFLANMKEIDDSFKRKIVAASLLTDPLNPLISNEVYQTFPHVYLDNVLRRVENTRTLRNLALRNHNKKNLVRQLMSDEHNHNLYVYWRAFQMGETYSECATEHTRIARNVGWGRKIIGVTTPHPLEYIHEKVCTNGNVVCDGSDYIYVKFDNAGDFAPYLGSTVRTKVISNQDIEARGEPLICTSSRVARYANWISLGDNYKTLLMANVSAVCDTSIYDTFMDTDPTGSLFSGSIEHRFNPAAASEGCFINYVPQLGHKIFMSSDYMPEFGRGNTNVTLHFQATYSYLQYIDLFAKGNSFYHHHLLCHKCIVPVEDSIPDIDDITHILKDLYAERVSSLIKDTLGFIDKKIPKCVARNEPLSGFRVPLHLADNSLVRDSLHIILAFKCASILFYRNRYVQSYTDIEDLQKFPRVIAYKVYRDKLIILIAKSLICIQAAHVEIAPFSENIHKLKNTLNKFLSECSIAAFQDIASLCIGRNDYNKGYRRTSEPISPDFPESVSGFLTGIKTSIILTVDTLNTVRESQIKNIYIPSSFMSRREHILFLCCLDMMKNECFGMAMTLKDNLSSHLQKVEYVECRLKHLYVLLQKCPLIDTTLERMAKCVGPLITREAPILIRKKRGCVGAGYISDSEHSKVKAGALSFPHWLYSRSFTINLPSPSFYKWEAINETFKDYDNFIVIGDKSGGISLSLARRFPNSNVFPLSLFDKHQVIPQDLTAMKPLLSRHLINVHSTFQENLPDNVLSENWKDCFIKEIQRFNLNLTVLISDMHSEHSNIHLQRQIFDIVPVSLSIVFKLYYHERSEWIDYLSSYKHSAFAITPFGDIGDGEIFFSGVRSRRKRDISETDIDYCLKSILSKHHDWCNYGIMYKKIRGIEDDFPEATNASINIANTHLIYLGMNVPMEFLKENAVQLICWCLYQINIRYRYHIDLDSQRNKKVLDPLRIDKLTRFMRIILIIVMEDSMNYPEWISNTIILHKNEARDYVQHCRIFFLTDLSSTNTVVLNERDFLCAATLHNARRQVSEDFLPICSSYCELWETLIKPEMTRILRDNKSTTSITPSMATDEGDEYYQEY